MVGREKKSRGFVNMASREEVWDNAKVGETGGENHGAREAARTGRAQGRDECRGRLLAVAAVVVVSARSRTFTASATHSHKPSRYCRLFCFQFY